LERELQAPAEAIFPLLCPTMEYDWVPGWSCELLHSESGKAEPDAVFRTNLRGREEIWVCTRFEPSRVIHYTRVSQDRVEKLEITLVPGGNRTTGIRWSLTSSALTHKANPAVLQMEEGPARRQILEQLLDDLAHYLAKGEMRN
jgi:hypothetical protein